MALPVGAVSELLTEESALWILRLDAMEAARPATFEESLEDVRQAVLGERLADLESEIATEWLESLAIEVVGLNQVGRRASSRAP